MGATGGAGLIIGNNRKEASGGLIRGVAETTLGSGLMNAIIAKQRCVEDGMKAEAEIFEESIQRFRTELTQIGLDPDQVVTERIRLLTESLQKKEKNFPPTP